MATGAMTAVSMATWIPEVWSSLADVSYHTAVILPDLMDRRWESEMGAGRGDTVNIPQFTQKGRGFVNKRSVFGTVEGLTFNHVQENQTQLVIDQLAYYAFRMNVELSVQKMAQYEQLLSDAAGPSIAEQVDYELASDDTNGLDALTTAVGADNVDVTDDVILESETNLNNVNAPLNDRFFVMSPATRGSLMQIEAIRNQLYGKLGNISATAGQGYLGPLYTLQCYMTNNLEAGTSGKKNAIFHRYAIAFAEQQSVKVEKGLNIAGGLINEYAAYNVYGFKMIKASFGYVVNGK